MTEYIVGLRQGKQSEVLTIEAEDALIAALKVKHNHPEALISYVRKSNRKNSDFERSCARHSERFGANGTLCRAWR